MLGLVARRQGAGPVGGAQANLNHHLIISSIVHADFTNVHFLKFTFSEYVSFFNLLINFYLTQYN